jgi:hypothetical protein
MTKEQEAGLPTAEVCRQHGLSPDIFDKLKLGVSDARLLRLGAKSLRKCMMCAVCASVGRHRSMWTNW